MCTYIHKADGVPCLHLHKILTRRGMKWGWGERETCSKEGLWWLVVERQVVVVEILIS